MFYMLGTAVALGKAPDHEDKVAGSKAHCPLLLFLRSQEKNPDISRLCDVKLSSSCLNESKIDKAKD